jgi:hypothetical protein
MSRFGAAMVTLLREDLSFFRLTPVFACEHCVHW